MVYVVSHCGMDKTAQFPLGPDTDHASSAQLYHRVDLRGNLLVGELALVGHERAAVVVAAQHGSAGVTSSQNAVSWVRQARDADSISRSSAGPMVSPLPCPCYGHMHSPQCERFIWQARCTIRAPVHTIGSAPSILKINPSGASLSPCFHALNRVSICCA